MLKNVHIRYCLFWLLLLSCTTAPNTSEPEEDTEPVEDDIITAEDYFLDREVEVIQHGEDREINIVFLGEGFPRVDLKREDGVYRTTAMRDIEFMFSMPPFDHFRDEFNIYIVYAANIGVQTAFNFSNQSLSSTNFSKIQEYVDLATGTQGFTENTLVLFSVKTENLFGFSANKYAYYSYNNPTVMIHEVGHAFGFLGDEYEFGSESPLDLLSIDGVNSNLDTTSDSAEVKWRHFFGVPGYEEVGIYEGGFYRSTGVFRPTENSIMRTTLIADPPLGFNAPSREAIVKEIYRLTNRTYTFDAFLAID